MVQIGLVVTAYGTMSPPSMELTNHPGAAASIDADEFELICHSHSQPLLLQLTRFVGMLEFVAFGNST